MSSAKEKQGKWKHLAMFSVTNTVYIYSYLWKGVKS